MWLKHWSLILRSRQKAAQRRDNYRRQVALMTKFRYLGELNKLPPELRFYQLELVRGQRAADTAIAFGQRANAADAYDTVVTDYKKDPKKNWGMVPQLKEKCTALRAHRSASSRSPSVCASLARTR